MGALTHTVEGTIANFRSATCAEIENLKCKFLPKLDLHGYTKSWPAGGGNNIWDEEWEIGGLDTSTGLPNEETNRIRSKNYIPILPDTTYYWLTANMQFVGFMYDENYTVLPWPNETTNYKIISNASFTTSTEAKYFKFYCTANYGTDYNNNIALNYPSTVTAYSPYENVCPIEGKQNATVYKTGKNLFNKNDSSIIVRGLNMTNEYGTGYLIDSASKATIIFLPCKPSTTYTASKIPTARSAIAYVETDTIPVDGDLVYGYFNFNNATSGTTITSSKATYLCVYINNELYDNTPIQNILDSVLIEIGATATEYEPYCGDVTSVDFPCLNLLNPADIFIYNNTMVYNNGIYSNPAVDTRTSVLFAVQLWKTKGSYIKTAATKSYIGLGRQYITFNVDDENCKYLAFKHNGTTRDFILLFPLPAGLQTYTISCDVLANDPTTVNGVLFTNFLLETGNLAHRYEQYGSSHVTYGGYVDVAAGQLAITHETIVCDGSIQFNITEYDDLNRFIMSVTALGGKPAKLNGLSQYCLNNYLNQSSSGAWSGYISSVGNYVVRVPKSIDSWETFKAYLQEHPIEFTYELETPLYYPMDSLLLQTFYDYNNIYSNLNSTTEVTYEVIDSDMIREIKKYMFASNQGHYKKVTWNLWLKPLNSTNWQGYNANNVSVIFDESAGIATGTWLVDDKRGYNTSIVNNTMIPINSTDIWYVSYMVKPSKAGLKWGVEFMGGRQLDLISNVGNTDWTLCSTTGTQYLSYTAQKVYISNCRSAATDIEIGMSAQNKAPYLVNLTLMFGAGNEPTKEEFERICKINNIDFTTYSPYTEGTELWWIIP